MSLISPDAQQPADPSKQLKRRAGLRGWARRPGGAGLPAAEEARVMRIEAELRGAERKMRAGGS